MEFHNDDAESNLFLRRCRDKLGYGCGWTFWGALVEWIVPKLIPIAIVSAFIFLSLHIKIEISLR